MLLHSIRWAWFLFSFYLHFVCPSPSDFHLLDQIQFLILAELSLKITYETTQQGVLIKDNNQRRSGVMSPEVKQGSC